MSLYNKSIFEKCTRMKTAGFSNKVWTHYGMVNFKIGENPNEPPKIIYNESDCDVLTLCIPRLSVPRDHVRIGIESVQRSGARDIFSEL